MAELIYDAIFGEGTTGQLELMGRAVAWRVYPTAGPEQPVEGLHAIAGQISAAVEAGERSGEVNGGEVVEPGKRPLDAVVSRWRWEIR